MPKLGIRREDKNEWERRTPLTPAHVKRLAAEGLTICVQPSPIRVFGDEEFVEAGAEVREDLADCDVVFGIKEFPANAFREGQACIFFSHVIKGQAYNMPMLQAILDCGGTLIEYEKVTDESGQRMLYFGNFAGLAGMIETLYAYGRRLESEGILSPFVALKRPLDYGSLPEAQAALEVIGKWIATDGLPEQTSPLVVGFAGYGNVSKGAQSILDLLPVAEVAPADLSALAGGAGHSRHKVYKTVFHEHDMVKPRHPDDSFDLQDYYQNPERYEGVFDQYLQHLEILVNGIYWDERYPRLVTREWLGRNWRSVGRPKVIGDISCDVEGSIECTLAPANPGRPAYTYLPDSGSIEYGYEGDGPVIMAVDTLPCELPRESSSFFGDLLVPYVYAIASAGYGAAHAELDLPPEVKRAVITHGGELAPDYRYLSAHL